MIERNMKKFNSIIYYLNIFILLSLSSTTDVYGQTFQIIKPNNFNGVPDIDEFFNVEYYLPSPSITNVQLLFEPASPDPAGTRTVILDSSFQSTGTHSVIIKHLAIAEQSSSISSVSPKNALINNVFYTLRLQYNPGSGVVDDTIFLRAKRCSDNAFADTTANYACKNWTSSL